MLRASENKKLRTVWAWWGETSPFWHHNFCWVSEKTYQHLGNLGEWQVASNIKDLGLGQKTVPKLIKGEKDQSLWYPGIFFLTHNHLLMFFSQGLDSSSASPASMFHFSYSRFGRYEGLQTSDFTEFIRGCRQRWPGLCVAVGYQAMKVYKYIEKIEKKNRRPAGGWSVLKYVWRYFQYIQLSWGWKNLKNLRWLWLVWRWLGDDVLERVFSNIVSRLLQSSPTKEFPWMLMYIQHPRIKAATKFEDTLFYTLFPED